MKTRKLTAEEDLTVSRFSWKAGHVFEFAYPDRVAYVHRDDFTTCVLLAGRKVLSAGASKRNPVDAENPKRGQFLALRRALEAME